MTLLKPMLDSECRFNIDAIPRLQAAPELKSQEALSDPEHAHIPVSARTDLGRLEHARMRDAMLARTNPDEAFNAATCWHAAPADAWLTAVLQKRQPFRDDDKRPEVDLRLVPNEDGDEFTLQRAASDKTPGKGKSDIWSDVGDSQLQRIPDKDVQGQHISPWGQTDYLLALAELAEKMDMPLKECAEKFGALSLKEPDNEGNGWRFHPALGFTRRGRQE